MGGFQSRLADILTPVTAQDVLILVPTGSGVETMRFLLPLGWVLSPAQPNCASQLLGKSFLKSHLVSDTQIDQLL